MSNFGTAPFAGPGPPIHSFLTAPPAQPPRYEATLGQAPDQMKRPGMFKSFSYSGRSSGDTGTVSPASLHDGSPEHISDSQYSEVCQQHSGPLASLNFQLQADIQLHALALHHGPDVQDIPAYTHNESLLQIGWVCREKWHFERNLSHPSACAAGIQACHPRS